ncbi:hypothetical protein BSLG_002107 [Batrachochytrium salamandrivorans]|nr:hypothetical protein BSLG_002107 [Batrachochytrium salamandrivorans]
MSLTYLVTGGAGFIGSHTAEALLRRGDSVLVVDEMNDYYSLRQKQHNLDKLAAAASHCNSVFKFYQGSCEDEAFMAIIFETEHIDRVCHLAARAGVRPSIKANVTATVTLLELARLHSITNFVYASSSSVYGSSTKVPFAESDATDCPVSPYAATKKSCELMAATYNHLYALPTIGLRFFTVYGPRGRPDMAPFLFVDHISRGLPINKFGNGTSCRDYTYISDIVSGILASLDSPRKDAAIFNLGNSTTVSLEEFISVIESTVGEKAIINQLPEQPGDVPRTFADLTLSSRELGYKPTTDIRTGMRLFVDWYRSEYPTLDMGLEYSPSQISIEVSSPSAPAYTQISSESPVTINAASLRPRSSLHSLSKVSTSCNILQSPSPPPSECLVSEYAMSASEE